MGEENSYSIVVEYLYKNRKGREIIPILFDCYGDALNACEQLCQKQLSHFIELHGKGIIVKNKQNAVPFEPYYEMWQVVNETEEHPEEEEYEDKFYYVARPIIIIHYLNVPNKLNNYENK